MSAPIRLDPPVNFFGIEYADEPAPARLSPVAELLWSLADVFRIWSEKYLRRGRAR